MVDVVRAWKDKKYRATLTEQELAQLPKHPAGNNSSVSAEELAQQEGGSLQTIIVVITRATGCI